MRYALMLLAIFAFTAPAFADGGPGSDTRNPGSAYHGPAKSPTHRD